jgi:threonine/homoserine/homoserine lactone efflux protein
MNTALFSSFLVGVLVMQVIPGPGMLFLIANGVAGGARAGVAVAFGTAAGMLVHTTLTALGLAALLRAAPEALAVIKVIGALYLFWLALQAFRTRRQSMDTEPAGHRNRFWSLFGRGALNNLGNPKIVVFYVVFLPQFVDPAVGHVTRQLFILGGTMLSVGLVVDLQIGLLAGLLRGVLLRSRIFRRALNKISGTIYGALAARLITAH